MRFVICDDDDMVSQVLDVALSDMGHELVGSAAASSGAIDLIEQTKPDLVVIEPAVGCGSEFDAVDAAHSVGARVVLFSREAMRRDLGRYKTEPTMVLKPDVTGLEKAIDELAQTYPDIERRRHPTRRFQSTGPSDAAAFYAAMNEAIQGDAFVSVRPAVDNAESWLWRVTTAIRETDLVMQSSTAVFVFMPTAGKEGVHALHERLLEDSAASNDGVVCAVVLESGESPNEAFTRLKDATL